MRRTLTRDLTLQGQPVTSPVPGINDDWYASFGRAYDVARGARLQPRAAIREANPWMMASQYATYLRRARDLGLVQSAGRNTVQQWPAEEVKAPAPPPVRASGRRVRGRIELDTPEPAEDTTAELQRRDDEFLRQQRRRWQRGLAELKAKGEPVTPEAAVGIGCELVRDVEQAAELLDLMVERGRADRVDGGVLLH